MNATGIERRIRKLEGKPKEGLTAMTWDELDIMILDLSRLTVQFAKESGNAEGLKDASRTVAEIEADIIKSAIEQTKPSYEGHLDWCRAMWRKRTGKDDYTPALFHRGGLGEYCNWDMPDIMARRSALRAKPIVQEILERVPETTDFETEAGRVNGRLH